MAAEEPNLVQYLPFNSVIAPSFWYKLSQMKIDVDRLEENVRHVWGYYTKQGSSSLFVDCSSFNTTYDSQKNQYPAYGYLLNKNTLESFKACDKVALLNQFGAFLQETIANGTALEKPYLLVSFVILTFAEIKTHQFYYWFAFPSCTNPVSYYVNLPQNLSSHFSEEQIKEIYSLHSDLPESQQAFFGIMVEDKHLKLITIKEFVNFINSGSHDKKVFLGFVDSNNVENHPGWPLRNLLILIKHHCPGLSVPLEVISLRFGKDSLVFSVKITVTETEEENGEKWIGWERNVRGKFGPRFVDLSEAMDPKKLAEQCTYLNLKLMKWRLVPELDLTSVRQAKCLLFGAGTLGCAVARSLLSWGVDKITLVDSGKVSFSNPVRQCLFNFVDSENGGRYKAEAAASALKAIFPNVAAEGVVMSVPMPGHGLDEAANVEKVEELISRHDVVFLLTDSRESRWLPTLISTFHQKITITAALGFDSYLVMRHGLFHPGSDAEKTLGCYFCNDVTAPGNSSLDRTLDQQCTVTRPGVSNIAASLAVELMVSLLQHPSRGLAGVSDETCLGAVPHSVRGFLSSFSQIMPATPAFSQCTACSPKVMNEYRTRKSAFLIDVFECATYLEDLTGLTELHKTLDTKEVWELNDTEEFGD